SNRPAPVAPKMPASSRPRRARPTRIPPRPQLCRAGSPECSACLPPARWQRARPLFYAARGMMPEPSPATCEQAQRKSGGASLHPAPDGRIRSGALDAPEHREAARDDAGQFLAVSGCLPVFAHRDERQVFEHLPLHLGTNLVLFIEVGGVEPLRA